MRRLRNLLVLTLAASGCLYGSEQVRQSPPVEPPPPAPYDASLPPYDPGYQGYQAEAPPPPPGTDVSSDAVFYDQLAPYGSWTWVAPYGRVWVPAVGWGWRPYYYGQWVLTDWGWTFTSDDPWGWAAYHYGRWNWTVGVGWYWIPGIVWAPAWVTWGYGAGYVTWCPLGPPGVVFGYHHPAWVAVPEQHFTRPISRVALPSQKTFPVVTQVRPLSGPQATVPRGRGHGFGPPVADVSRATGNDVHPVTVAQAARPRIAPVAQPASPGPMRSPMLPRARTTLPGAHYGSRLYPTAAPRPIEVPHQATPGQPGISIPRVVPPPVSAPPVAPPAAAPPSGGGAPHAAPPSSGGGPHAGGPRGFRASGPPSL